MPIQFDYQNLLHTQKIRSGIPKEIIEQSEQQIKVAHQTILDERKHGKLGFYELPDQDVSHITSYIDKIKGKFNTIVVLGIGGSALGNKAIYSALKVEKQLKNKVLVADNVDPLMLKEILDQVDLKKTLFNCITKSGTTAETMSVFLILMQILKDKFPDDYKEHIVITTDKDKGFLREIVRKEGYQDFEVPGNVGGRFSVLSDVGLLSCAFAGIDINALLAGATAMRSRCEQRNIWNNPAYLNGLLHYHFMRNGKNISVMMPYSNSLYDMADWYRQLWAESLGKRKDNRGRDIYVGQTPVKALGTTDQHSQVQLYTEGPNDKVFTFLSVEHFQHDYTIPNLHPERDEISYLGGKQLSQLLNAERFATEIALTKAARPNANLVFPLLDEYHLGEFIMMYEIQTVFTGKLLHIDPLDQPGVEAGKIATYALMGKA
ncbi:MAG TPA: glucose-6-phosphate isomerase, partial [Candidatus Cloacimonadota bacterium]|nr:glucose-6-phosphate isomerase [Candidatus Cloacimonadota bacterium]